MIATINPQQVVEESTVSGLLISVEPLRESRSSGKRPDIKQVEDVSGDAEIADVQSLWASGNNRLAKILEPTTPEEFLASYWGKTYLHGQGWSGKFAHLLPWQQLNDILRRHRMDSRLNLFLNGKSLPSSAYMRQVVSSMSKIPVSRLLPVKLTEHLRQGATLVLSSVDRLYEPLEQLVEDLEFAFHEPVQINTYAGWGSSKGFDLHWDGHEVFILQVAGRKHWSLYGTTRPYPLTGDDQDIGRPTQAPVWEGTLNEGDFLYIPRGCWHVAVPLNEPTLHLTIGIHARTGLDLLHWFADRMRSSLPFRKNLPHLATAADRRAHMEQLRHELWNAWSAELVDSFYSESDVQAEPRERLSLPWSATPAILPASPDLRVRLTASRLLDLKIADGVVEFTSNKQRWRFAEAAAGMLTQLFERRICSVAELCEVAGGRLEEEMVRAFVAELVLHGLVVLMQD